MRTVENLHLIMRLCVLWCVCVCACVCGVDECVHPCPCIGGVRGRVAKNTVNIKPPMLTAYITICSRFLQIQSQMLFVNSSCIIL